MRSKFTIEPLPTAEEIYKDMVQLYLDERGYGDLHDVYRVLLSEDPAKIGIELFNVIEDMNEEKMLSEGLCGDCGTDLINVHLPATSEDPEENYLRCPLCLIIYTRLPIQLKDKELISKEQIAYEEEMEAIRKSEYAKGEWI